MNHAELIEFAKSVLLKANSARTVYLQLLGALCVLCLSGNALRPRSLSISFTPYLGQLLGICYLLARSALSHFYAWPNISESEVLTVSAIFCGVGCVRLLKDYLSGNSQMLLLLPLFILALMLIPLFVQADWPLLSMRSGDATLHAFFAHQIVQRGGIPWSQLPLGSEPFHYPVGFASLNAVWMVLANLSALEIIPLQLGMQVLLLIGFLVSRFAENSPRLIHIKQLFWLSMLGAVFFLSVPLGFMHMPDHTGLGRYASIFFLGLILVTLKTARHPTELLFLIPGIAILATLNPALPCLPAALFLFFIFQAQHRKMFTEIHFPFWLVIFIFLFSALILLGDPLFFNGVFHRSLYWSSVPNAPTALSASTPIFASTSQIIRAIFEKVKHPLELLFGNGIYGPGSVALFVLVNMVLGTRRFYFSLVIPSLLLLIFFQAILHPQTSFELGLLRIYLGQLEKQIVCLAQIALGLFTATRLMSVTRKEHNGLLWRKSLFILWALSLPWWANAKRIAHRGNDKPGFFSDRSLNDLTLFVKKIQNFPENHTLLVPTRSGLVSGGEYFVAPVTEYTPFAFLPNINLAFFYMQGNKEYSGKAFSDLGLNLVFDESGAQVSDPNAQTLTWLKNHNIVLLSDFLIR